MLKSEGLNELQHFAILTVEGIGPQTQVDGEVYTVTSHPLFYWNSLDEFYTKNIQ